MGMLIPLSAADPEWRSIPEGRVASLSPITNRPAGFTLLAPEQTGVHFQNGLRDALAMENNNLTMGSGVALGDVDGDGRCDLFFAAIDGTNALYRNLGDWRFEDVTARSGLGFAGHSTGAVLSDVDGDGDLDLLLNTLGEGTHVFLNDGKGRFADATDAMGLRSRQGSIGLALADVDGDGDLDLYVSNYGAVALLRAGGQAEMRKGANGQWELSGAASERLRLVDGRLEEVGEPDVLYRNEAGKRFVPVPWNSEWFLDAQGKPMPAPWDFGLTVQMRDLNGDGFPDIYVCNDFQTVDRQWMNDGTGHFRLMPRLALRHQSFASMGVDFADIDRDGQLDFFVVEMMGRDHRRRMQQVSGIVPDTFPPGFFENRPEIPRNTLFHNRGDGSYAEIAHYSGVEATDWSWSPLFLDVDLDGWEDLLVMNGHAFDVQDRDALRLARSVPGQTPVQARTNLLLYPRLLTPNVAFRNRGDLTFQEVARQWGLDSRRISNGAALADMDQDGDLDLVVNCLYDGPLIYRNDSPAPRVAVRLHGRGGNTQAIGAKIRLLGGAVLVQSQEIVSGGRYVSGDDPMRTFAVGPHPGRMRLEVDWRSGHRTVVDPVQPNSLYFLEEPEARAQTPATPSAAVVSTPWFEDVSARLGHTHHEELFNDFASQPLLPRQLSQLGPGIAWFDLDGDGHDDLMIGAGKGSKLTAYLGDGHGGFEDISKSARVTLPDDLTGLASWIAPSGVRWMLTGVATVESGSQSQPAFYAWTLDVASQRFGAMPLRNIPAGTNSAGPLAVADYDGDGDLDVFVGGRVSPGMYPVSASSHVYRRDETQFSEDERNLGLLDGVGLVSAAVWSDLDGDGFPELILACEWGPIRVFKNDHGRLQETTRDWGLASWTGWWNSVTAADVDNDGRMDLIVGNWGLNSQDHASPESPARIFYADVRGAGTMDVVEAYRPAELEGVYPRRSLSVLGQAFPSLNEFYPNAQSFGTATVAQIERQLQTHFKERQAVTLASMVFLNRSNHFEPIPLPAEAQWSPVFGISCADVDGDGWMDIYLGQNFFSVRPELPRQDGGCGLWLRGVGKGRFEPVSAQRSGVRVYGEQRGTAISDYDEDGRPDLVVTQNGAATRLFHNTQGRPGLRVRLRGGTGNPEGIGCVLRPRYETGWGGAVEVHAGAGYWSQDSTVVLLHGDKPIQKVQVRWPGGQVTESDVAAGLKETTILR